MLPEEPHTFEDLETPTSSFTAISTDDAKGQFYSDDEDTADFQEHLNELKYRQIFKEQQIS